MPNRNTDNSRTLRDGPHRSAVVWFAVLERARLTADPVLTRHARQALSRLGIRVTFGRRPDAEPAPALTDPDLERIAARLADLLRGHGVSSVSAPPEGPSTA